MELELELELDDSSSTANARLASAKILARVNFMVYRLVVKYAV